MPERLLIRGGSVVDGTWRAGARSADVPRSRTTASPRCARRRGAARRGAEIDATRPRGGTRASSTCTACTPTSRCSRSRRRQRVPPGRDHRGNGNCGGGVAPVDARARRLLRRLRVRRELGRRGHLALASASYLALLDDMAVNAATLVPHGALRNAVMGLEPRAPGHPRRARTPWPACSTRPSRPARIGALDGLEYQPGSFADDRRAGARSPAWSHATAASTRRTSATGPRPSAPPPRGDRGRPPHGPCPPPALPLRAAPLRPSGRSRRGVRGDRRARGPSPASGVGRQLPAGLGPGHAGRPAGTSSNGDALAVLRAACAIPAPAARSPRTSTRRDFLVAPAATSRSSSRAARPGPHSRAARCPRWPRARERRSPTSAATCSSRPAAS